MIVLFFVLFGVTSSHNQSSTKSTASIPASPTPTPTTEQQIQSGVAKAFNQDKSSKTSFDRATGTVTIVYGEGDHFFDEQSTINGLVTMFVKSGREVFNINGVTNLSITVRGSFTDVYGQSQIEDAGKITMTKEEFEKFNWDNLVGQSVYNGISLAATEFYIHPAILKAINLDKIDLGSLN